VRRSDARRNAGAPFALSNPMLFRKKPPVPTTPTPTRRRRPAHTARARANTKLAATRRWRLLQLALHG